MFYSIYLPVRNGDWYCRLAEKFAELDKSDQRAYLKPISCLAIARSAAKIGARPGNNNQKNIPVLAAPGAEKVPELGCRLRAARARWRIRIHLS